MFLVAAGAIASAAIEKPFVASWKFRLHDGTSVCRSRGRGLAESLAPPSASDGIARCPPVGDHATSISRRPGWP